MKSLSFFFVIAFYMFFSNNLYSADPADVAKVIKLMRSKQTRGLIQQQTSKEGGLLIAFVVKDKKYKFYYVKNEITEVLSIWEYLKNSRGIIQTKIYNDELVDGVVNFGMIDRLSNEQNKKYQKAGIGGKTGEDFEKYWQDTYDEAISNALHKLK